MFTITTLLTFVIYHFVVLIASLEITSEMTDCAIQHVIVKHVVLTLYTYHCCLSHDTDLTGSPFCPYSPSCCFYTVVVQ